MFRKKLFYLGSAKSRILRSLAPQVLAKFALTWVLSLWTSCPLRSKCLLTLLISSENGQVNDWYRASDLILHAIGSESGTMLNFIGFFQALAAFFNVAFSQLSIRANRPSEASKFRIDLRSHHGILGNGIGASVAWITIVSSNAKKMAELVSDDESSGNSFFDDDGAWTLGLGIRIRGADLVDCRHSLEILMKKRVDFSRNTGQIQITRTSMSFSSEKISHRK